MACWHPAFSDFFWKGVLPWLRVRSWEEVPGAVQELGLWTTFWDQFLMIFWWILDDFGVQFGWFTLSWASLGPVGCSRGVPDAQKCDFSWILAPIWTLLGAIWAPILESWDAPGHDFCKICMVFLRTLVSEAFWMCFSLIFHWFLVLFFDGLLKSFQSVDNSKNL